MEIEKIKYDVNKKDIEKVYWETIINSDNVLKKRLICKGSFGYIHITCSYDKTLEGFMVINLQVNSILGLFRFKTYINRIIEYIFNEYKDIKKINLFILEIENFAMRMIKRTKFELEVRYIDSIKYNGMIMDYMMYGVLRDDRNIYIKQ